MKQPNLFKQLLIEEQNLADKETELINRIMHPDVCGGINIDVRVTDLANELGYRDYYDKYILNIINYIQHYNSSEVSKNKCDVCTCTRCSNNTNIALNKTQPFHWSKDYCVHTYSQKTEIAKLLVYLIDWHILKIYFLSPVDCVKTEIAGHDIIEIGETILANHNEPKYYEIYKSIKELLYTDYDTKH